MSNIFKLFAIILLSIITINGFSQDIKLISDKAEKLLAKGQYNDAIGYCNEILNSKINELNKYEYYYYCSVATDILFKIYSDEKNNNLDKTKALKYLKLNNEFINKAYDVVPMELKSDFKSMIKESNAELDNFIKINKLSIDNLNEEVKNNSVISNIQPQDDKIVTLIINGQGKTPDEAKQSALLNAIEKAFGTFISTRTELLGDSLVKNEIISVTNGNIKNYDLISETLVPNIGYQTTLKVTLSVSKLLSFVESKGGVINLNSGAFSYNVKKEDFYTKNETDVIKNFFSTRLLSQNFFNYTIISKSPKVEAENYSIELEIGIKANENLFLFFSQFYKLLQNITLDDATINFRKESNLPIYKIKLKDESTYYLRSQNSFNYLSSIDSLLFLKTGDFKLKSVPEFKLPNADVLIKSNIVANNFIILNRQHSPNPGVYWSWLPYTYSEKKSEISDRWMQVDSNSIMLSDDFLKHIPKQSELNSFSDHMGNIINNGRTDYNLVIRHKLLFSKFDFEKLDSLTLIPTINNF